MIVDFSPNPPVVLILFICRIEMQSMEETVVLAPFPILQNAVTTSYASYAPVYLYLLLLWNDNIDIAFVNKKPKSARN